ncbi:hypothetical protein DXT99_24095 [Pontibacter diazotrophicus]|uniref:Uncharacterized protein n=1 Tax=Pontibacter diazotrophicus TaxID=1400979 RepID=A0A3D8L328_9BACT|nr:hypothetical protein DXT99_24095 [Pontibacter diazotrophicus]
MFKAIACAGCFSTLYIRYKRCSLCLKYGAKQPERLYIDLSVKAPPTKIQQSANYKQAAVLQPAIELSKNVNGFRPGKSFYGYSFCACTAEITA